MRTQTLRTFWKQARSKRENETAPAGQEVLAGMFPGKQIMSQKGLKKKNEIHLILYYLTCSVKFMYFFAYNCSLEYLIILGTLTVASF